MEKRRGNYWVSFLLALLLLFGGTASSALAATADVEIENLTGDSAIAEEQTGITVDIVVKNHPNFRGADFNITYPTEVFAKCNGGQTMDGSTWMIGNITPGTGSVHVLLAGSAGQVPEAAETTLVQLSFDAATSIPDGSYKFAITYDETDASKGILDDTMTPLELTITGGDIEIARAPKVTATVSAPEGTIEPEGTTTYEENQTPTYTVTPAAGYQVLIFTVGGQDKLSELSNGTAGGTYTFTTGLVAGDNIAIDVAFKLIPTYTVTASAGENGTISDAGEMTYNEGATPTYTVTPDAHYEVETFEVLGDDTAALTDNGNGTYSYDYAAIAADSTISVTFKIKQYAVTATAGENGKISPAEETLYSALSTPAYTITPDTANNYVIDTVTVDGADVTGSANYVLNDDKSAVYTFAPLEGPATIDVTFKPGVFEITVIKESGGSVEAVDNEIVDGVVTVVAGADQKLKVTAKEGYYIKKVKVDDKKQDIKDNTSFSYTFDEIATDHTFDVRFDKMYTITASAGKNGTIDPAGEIMVADGDSLTFTVTPDEDYEVKMVTVDGAEVELTDGAYTIESIDAAHTIVASFEHKDARIVLNGGDYDYDFMIIFDELLRVIQLYNADGYHCDETGVDGFAPDEQGVSYDALTDYNCKPHGSDYDDPEMGNTQDWTIDFYELLRAIQFYNTEDGYHVDETTPDGFAPGME
ncbi:InlB B-repeat-containing protein [Desulfonema magnum]|uniref:Bacterial repeat domain-containing protein n=1 Tax=Desulfonema magnum TaxID=45655 RepID=A0A975BXQ6_9BACT|nr:hypothetical protein [Desulfonema magnum]QTA93243.1 Uncharacterized protein dnm_093440 [Desulfonema magnum]